MQRPGGLRLRPSVRLAWGTPARGAAAASRPLYFQRIMNEADLKGRSVGELGLMRDAILARAPELSAIDRKNLAGIELWEKRARALEGLPSARAGVRRGRTEPDAIRMWCECARCSARQARGTATLARRPDRMSWAAVPDYDDYRFRSLGPKTKVVRVDCGPDIDADGSPEAIVMLTGRTRSRRTRSPESMYLLFLASRHGTKWHAVAPLGFREASRHRGLDRHRRPGS